MSLSRGKAAKTAISDIGEVKWVGWSMNTAIKSRTANRSVISEAERAYLASGVQQPGGKLPLFDARGQEISASLIQACLKKGYAVRWFANPLKPDWLVCRLTDKGRRAIA